MRRDSFILILFVFFFLAGGISCFFAPSVRGFCQFVEHSSQIFPSGDGFFTFDIRDYKNKRETLLIRYFDREAKQICSEEMEYPFSFYNFLVRSKNNENILLISQDRRNGKDNLIIELSRGCKKVSSYNISAENFETISDVVSFRDRVILSGWAESKAKGIPSKEIKVRGDLSKIVVEHDMLLINSDQVFNEQKRVIEGSDDAEYIFSMVVSANNNLYYTGSIMDFEIDSKRDKVLKNVYFFISEGDPAKGVYNIKRTEYLSEGNFMPFFLKEYDETDLLLVMMGQSNFREVLSISYVNKKDFSINTEYYPVWGRYVPLYPVLVKDKYVVLRFFELTNGIMNRFYIIDTEKKYAIDVTLEGSNRLGIDLVGSYFYLYYSVISKPCNESIYKSSKIYIEDLILKKRIQPELTQLIYRDIKLLKSAGTFKVRKKD